MTMTIRRQLAILLLTLAGAATTGIKAQSMFMIDYWAKSETQSKSVSFARNGDADEYSLKRNGRYNADYDVSQIKSIRHIPGKRPTVSMVSNVTAREGDQIENDTLCPKADKPVKVTYSTAANVSYTATDDSNVQLELTPQTVITASVNSDACYGFEDNVTSVTSLEPLITVSGWNPQTVHVRQQIMIGTQTVTFEWDYEDYGLVKTKYGVASLPTLKPALSEVVSVTAVETAESQQASARLAPMTVMLEEGQQQPASSLLSNLQGGKKTYEVTVRLRQSLRGEGLSAPYSMEENFLLKYNVEIDNGLVSTTYEKDYFWTEPHDNMHWMSYYRIYRTRTYSTGEKETDTFTYPYGHRVEHVVTADVQGTDDYIHSSEYQVGNYHFIYHNRVTGENNNDFIKVYYFKTGVPDLSLLNGVVTRDENQWADRGDLSSYTSPIYKYQDKPLQYNPQNPIEGWYAKDIEYNRRVDLLYNQHPFVRMYDMGIRFYDSILYLDNQLFDFSDYRMTYDFDFREQSTALPDGTPAKVFTHECNAKYLGKDFYVATVDTVYQIKE